MIINGFWYSIDKVLPPRDDEYQSIEVIVVLKSGAVGKGYRYYYPDKQDWCFYAGVGEFKDIETLGDDDVAYWTVIPACGAI